MKTFLLPHLICPACLPREEPLQPEIHRERDNDIESGTLHCYRCKKRFPIKEGIACLLPDPDSGNSAGQRRYEEAGMTGRYLWSHYGDLLGEKTREEGCPGWAELAAPGGRAALEAGCAVGRLTFELANRFGISVGCDLSREFITAARRLARERQITFTLPLEGRLTQRFDLTLPPDWRSDTVEFIVADALRLPFAATSFVQVASLNLLDRVAYPLAHLYDMNRVADDRQSCFLFADPFSWSTDTAPEERWLGGTADGPYPGRGLDNVRALLEGKGKVLTPPWSIDRSGTVAWRMRTHCNHFEVITSHYLLATR
ncbi:class I SAM-dependent methyltransferase [Trichlorobacter ammonificans]|uniref:Methyltransferase type 11 n=1 Tax=Trichlorobacter ammonificans TaxID=2916410 RepID=A0ABM9D951_9BACT|nr:methyltransferase domain-containing protein [Trichlorobacter ammonificans]CAH2031666.1 Methyltransferase type 11 [Trichlorobacter ammonificans]